MHTATQHEINRLIERVLGHRPVRTDDLLIEQLGAESADLASILAALERVFQVEIPENSLPGLRTPRDLYELILQKGGDTDPD